MPFKHFLTTAIDFERTHQVILQCLFNDPLFLKVATGLEVNDYKVQLEPVAGLFDLGIAVGKGKFICLIEIKMWSNLSDTQLERQWKYLEHERCAGVHILLGTSDLQYHRDADCDELAEFTYDHSCKVGYAELIRLLDRFIAVSEPVSPIARIATDYKDALSKQAAYLDGAWLDASAPLHFRAYSTYSKIKRHLLDESFYIYTVNNAGGARYILNDDRSSAPFNYKGHNFEIYQEMLDLQLMIRVRGDGVPNDIKNQLKERIIKELKRLDERNLPWCFENKCSKYHKIAVYQPTLQTLDDCRAVAETFKTLNPILREIVRTVED